MTLAFAADEQRRRDLRRMKAVATGLLVLAAVTYVVFARLEAAGAPGWVGYVVAAAEAAMVGAVADWFAVTALFRRPLGLPIPHTAVIPRKKDALAGSLADFVRSNFLSEEVVLDKVRRAEPTVRAGQWLRRSENADLVAGELAAVASAAISSVRDSDAEAVVRNVMMDQVSGTDWSPPLARLLDASVSEGTHRGLVTLGAGKLSDWLVDNAEEVLRTIAAQGPVSQRGPVRWAHEQVAARIHHDLLRFVREVRDQDGHAGRQYHEARQALDSYLGRLAADMRTDPAVVERVERAKRELLESPATHRAVADIWPTSKRLLLAMLADPDSDLRRRMSAQVASLGRRLQDDPGFQSSAQARLERAVTFLVQRYGQETVTLITETVEGWDAAETSRKIEVAVGRDLQYIRVNGTVVGALVGLAIHAFSQTIL